MTTPLLTHWIYIFLALSHLCVLTNIEQNHTWKSHFSRKYLWKLSFHWQYTAIGTRFEIYWWLTHWGRVTHICVSKLTIIDSDIGLLPGWRQTIIWTNVGIWLIPTLGTNFSEILSEIHISSFKKMHLKTSSAKCRPFCLSLNVLTWKYLSENETW